MAEGRRAALLEEERPEVFTCTLGNLGAGEEAELTLRLAGDLPVEDGEVAVRVPLVVAPRYVAGAALPGRVGTGTGPDTDAVPDASRVTPPVLLPGFPEPIDLALAVRLDPAGLSFGTPRSSLHAVVHGEDGSGVRRVAVRPGERVDRDLVLRVPVDAAGITSAAAATPDPDDPDRGTLSVTVVPPAAAAARAPARDVVVLLDRSGSMGGWKVVAARRAAGRLVDSLGADDRFALLAFDHEVEAYGDGALAPATDRERWRAGEWAGRLDARGGTELVAALHRALDLLAGGTDRERHLVVVTDAHVADEDGAVRALAHHGAGVRVSTVGIDRAVNGGLLRRLEALGGGRSHLVESEDRLDEALDAVRRSVSPPVLERVRVQGAGLDAGAWAAAGTVDVHAGRPLVLHGRWAGSAPATVEVEARTPAGEPWRAELAVVSSDGPARALWARARLGELEDRWVAHGGDERPLVDLSLATGVLCRFTAFVAVDDDGPVDADGAPTPLAQPAGAPSGWVPAPSFAAAPDAFEAGATIARLAAPAAASAAPRPRRFLGLGPAGRSGGLRAGRPRGSARHRARPAPGGPRRGPSAPLPPPPAGPEQPPGATDRAGSTAPLLQRAHHLARQALQPLDADARRSLAAQARSLAGTLAGEPTPDEVLVARLRRLATALEQDGTVRDAAEAVVAALRSRPSGAGADGRPAAGSGRPGGG